MIKTYIYGTPHGFNLYENDDMDNYFKGFYISSRRNRRLMVHRQDNGITTYNYLVYDIQEVEGTGRPHAFFGMSLVIGDNTFCPDFQKILQWFDFLFFDKIVKEKSLFIEKEVDDSNTSGLQYKINRFDECSNYVNWLKGVLPNIFSADASTSLRPIDETFESSRTGQVRCLNDQEEDAVILEAFTKYSWVTLAPEYKKEGQGDAGLPYVDLDFGDLYKKLSEWNASLLSVAIDISKAKLGDLESMQQDVDDSTSQIKTYCKQIQDQNEASKFANLLAGFEDLSENLSALISKIKPEGGGEPPKPLTMYCFSCKQYKDISQFHDKSSTKCISCESKEKRTCKKCGIQKPLDHFTGHSDICNECTSMNDKARRCSQCHRLLPLSMFSVDCSICDDCVRKRPSNVVKYLTIAISSLLVISLFALGYMHLHNSDSTAETVVQSDPKTNENGRDDAAKKMTVDESKFVEFEKELNVSEAFKCLDGKEDGNEYYQRICVMIDSTLWTFIDGSNSSDPANTIINKIFEYKLKFCSIIEEVGYTFEQEYWKNLVNDYKTLVGYTKSQYLDSNGKNSANEIINKYPERFSNWKDIINNKPSQELTPTPVSEQISIEIQLYKTDGISPNGDAKTYKDAKAVCVELGVGEFVVIKSNKKITFKKNNSFDANRPDNKPTILRLKAINEDSIKIESGDKEITITAKKQGFKKA